MARKRKRRKVEAETNLPKEPNPFDGLCDPPRMVPARLRLHLLLTPVLVVCFLVIGLLVVVIPKELAAPGPLITFEPAHWSKVEGELERVERTTVEVRTDPNGRLRIKEPRFNYHYRFRLANGQEFSGRSYSKQRLNPAFRPKSKVSIEYDPARPEVNRLEGTSANLPLPSPLLPALILLGVAVVVMGCSLWSTARRIKLLREGQLGWLFLTSAKIQKQHQTIDLPLDEFKQQINEGRERSREMAHQPLCIFLFWLYGFFMSFCVGIVSLVASILLPSALNITVPYPGLIILGTIAYFGGFLFVIIGPMRRSRQKWLDDANGIGPPQSLPRQDYGYIFETSSGEVVEGHAVVRLTTLDKEPPHSMLYDSAKPRRVLVLDSLQPVPIVSEGGWHAPIGLGVFVRLGMVILGLIVPTLIGWIASH